MIIDVVINFGMPFAIIAALNSELIRYVKAGLCQNRDSAKTNPKGKFSRLSDRSANDTSAPDTSANSPRHRHDRHPTSPPRDTSAMRHKRHFSPRYMSHRDCLTDGAFAQNCVL
jgi:hypothetical protein